MSLFKKVLIANRGEIALRVIRACRELGIKTAIVYSDVDKDTLPVRLADEAICIGPAKSAQSYLNIPAIITAAEITNAEAIHPGYGFLAENPQFVEACAASNITFIGPPAECIRNGGDKSKARHIMETNGIPVVPGSETPLNNDKEAMKIARNIKFPVILKASAGGGGKGMRIVEKEQDLVNLYRTAQKEAMAAFGNGEMYIEKYITDMRHIEVQIISDNEGNTVHLGERDCSIQRRHQKLIEEAPFIFSDQKFRDKIGALAIKAAKAMNYRNAGTIEFILDSEDKIYFMEINTRIQVEHPITEMITGIDIVKEQIKIAGGQPMTLKQNEIKFSGHSIECRINAEDPDTFIPSPGTISLFIPPGGRGVRVDSAAFTGWKVPVFYDSLIAKLIVHGSDRDDAISIMKRALHEFVIEGIKTTIPFYFNILNDPDFLSGNFNTHFLENSKRSNKQVRTDKK